MSDMIKQEPSVLPLPRFSYWLDRYMQQGTTLHEHGPSPFLWEQVVGHLDNSDNPLLRSHYWLGVNAEHKKPVLLDGDISRNHTLVLGATGKGKTARVLTPLALQIIRRSPDNPEERHGLVVLDMKGDMAMFHTLRQAAMESGRRFRFFGLDLGKSTHGYNPFLSKEWRKRSLLQRAEELISALRKNHGPGYGKGFYSTMNRNYFLNAFIEGSHQKPVQSFAELRAQYPHLKETLERKTQENMVEVDECVKALASVTQLNITPENSSPEVIESAIDMTRVVEEGEIAYFFLPALENGMTAREIAGLAMWDLVSCARKDRHTYCMIDETQCVLAANCALLLQQARGLGVGFIMANQTFSDLKNDDIDLRWTVWDNTRLKILLSGSDKELAEMLEKMGGTQDVYERDYSFGTAHTHTEGESKGKTYGISLTVSENKQYNHTDTKSKQNSTTKSESSAHHTSMTNTKINSISNGDSNGQLNSRSNNIAHALSNTASTSETSGIMNGINITQDGESQNLGESVNKTSSSGYSNTVVASTGTTDANSYTHSQTKTEGNSVGTSEGDTIAKATAETVGNGASTADSVGGGTTVAAGVNAGISDTRSVGDADTITTGFGLRQVSKPRISIDKLKMISQSPTTALVYVEEPSGLTKFEHGYAMVRMGYAISYEQYRKFDKMEWPTGPMVAAEHFPTHDDGMLTEAQIRDIRDYLVVEKENKALAARSHPETKKLLGTIRDSIEFYNILHEEDPQRAKEKYPKMEELLIRLPELTTLATLAPVAQERRGSSSATPTAHATLKAPRKGKKKPLNEDKSSETARQVKECPEFEPGLNLLAEIVGRENRGGM